MKRANWDLRAIRRFPIIAIFALALAAGCASCSSIEPDSDAAAVVKSVRLTQAAVATVEPGDFLSLPPKSLNVPSALHWQSVTLPYSLPRTVVPDAADDPRDMPSITAWYRIDVPSTSVAGEFDALYVPRWHTWGSLSIYANGLLIYSSIQEGIFSSFNDPLLIRLPSTLRDRELQLIVRMDSVRATGGALSSVWIGPMAQLRPLFEARRFVQNRVPQITSFVFVVLGLFALAFWARRRHETTQLLFFILSILFYARNLHYYVEDTRIPENWLSWMTVNSLGWLNIVVYLYARRVHGRRHSIVEKILVGAMSLASVFSLPVGSFNVALLSSFTYLVFMGVSFAVTFHLSYGAWRARTIEYAMLAGVLWLNLGLGIHDWLLQHWRIDIESFYMLPYGVFALLVFFLMTEVRRYVTAVSANEKASQLLEMRLLDRERELKVSYEKLREIEQAQLLSQERQRLMRDMHDGLGSALMSSLVAVERGQMEPGDVAQVLRECVDDLKITIDSLEPVGEDLLVLLATLRYRLEPRLEAAGIQLRWEVEPVPGLRWLNPGSALEILRMLQEILTNILKHADARFIRVVTQLREVEGEAEIVITVADDGKGFDVAALRNTGRGLKNLLRRAAAVEGRVDIESNPSGTTVQIRLPVRRERDSATA